MASDSRYQTWFQSQHPGFPIDSALSVIALSEQGATLPFIARYRKEATGNLDEVQIQTVLDSKETWDQVLKRQAHILSQIELQQKLTPELKERITNCFDLATLEDIYLPYKQRKKTKASLAKEAGIEPLAEWIWNCGHGTEKPQPGQTLELWAMTYRNESKGFKELPEVLAGALDILSEKISHDENLRKEIREKIFKAGHLHSTAGEKPKPQSKYEKYFRFSEAVESLLRPENSHRYMALRRGWIEQELRLSIGGGPKGIQFEKELSDLYDHFACPKPEEVPEPAITELLKKAAHTAFNQYVMPGMETELHRAIKTVADTVAVHVFAENIRKLLLAAPFGPKAVLGVDPGIRTGCKVAVIDVTGKYIENTVIDLKTEPGKELAKPVVLGLVEKYSIEAIAVGNGTYGRETESFLRETLKAQGKTTPVVMVSEAGASVYSASETAREEFPELDVTVRGAISIARRLQDPLAELVKIDPKSIGVGQYQHDIAPNQLKKSLGIVVDSCVNQVGVNLNTASYHLLSHVSGIGEAIAKNIVEHRSQKGLFASRQQLLEVSHLSSKTFEQAAGFLRIPEAQNVLDRTAVHPEQYSVLEAWAQTHSVSNDQLLLESTIEKLKADAEIPQKLGQYTWDDILKELQRPGRDPRDTFVPFNFLEGIHQLSDLKPGLECPGIVTNVTNFGAFVDIGVHQDGLVHLSQLSNKFIKDPRQVVSPGDRVKVKVLEVNLEKKQIALTMKGDAPAQRKFAPRKPRPQREHKPREGENTQTPANAAAQAAGGNPQQNKPREDRRPRRANERSARNPGGPRPEGGKRSSPFKGPFKGKPSGQNKPRRPAPDLSHNPFASALANLKVQK